MAELIEPMGAETLIHARTKTGTDIRVVVPRDKKVKIGEKLHLRARSGPDAYLRRRRKGGARMSGSDQATAA